MEVSIYYFFDFIKNTYFICLRIIEVYNIILVSYECETIDSIKL